MRLIDVDAFKREHRMADMCGDCDRTIRECEYDSGLSLMDFCDWLDDAPTIEKQEWIPCSERLPEEKQVVLISNGKGHVRCGQYQGLAFRDSDPTKWWWKNKTIETVIAWMPLPTPFSDPTPDETETET